MVKLAARSIQEISALNIALSNTAFPKGGVSGNPVLVQSRNGFRGNFEVVVPMTAGGLAHYWRDNDNPSAPWHGPISFGMEKFDAVGLIESNFGNPGNLEVIARSGDKLFSAFREQDGIWHGPVPIVIQGREVTGATGTPGFIQSRYGHRGNFELVTPLKSGYLAHYWRDNDNPSLPWNGPPLPFGQKPVEAVSLIESNFGFPGNLEGIGRADDQLLFFWRETTFQWFGPNPVLIDGEPVHGICGTPALIQSRYGHRGNFEVVVPLKSGGLAYYWRDNDNAFLPWHGPVRFGNGHVDAVSMIQSNYGHLEVLARVGDQLTFYWRGDDSLWNGPIDITSGHY